MLVTLVDVAGTGRIQRNLPLNPDCTLLEFLEDQKVSIRGKVQVILCGMRLSFEDYGLDIREVFQNAGKPMPEVGIMQIAVANVEGGTSR